MPVLPAKHLPELPAQHLPGLPAQHLPAMPDQPTQDTEQEDASGQEEQEAGRHHQPRPLPVLPAQHLPGLPAKHLPALPAQPTQETYQEDASGQEEQEDGQHHQPRSLQSSRARYGSKEVKESLEKKRKDRRSLRMSSSRALDQATSQTATTPSRSAAPNIQKTISLFQTGDYSPLKVPYAPPASSRRSTVPSLCTVVQPSNPFSQPSGRALHSELDQTRTGSQLNAEK